MIFFISLKFKFLSKLYTSKNLRLVRTLVFFSSWKKNSIEVNDFNALCTYWRVKSFEYSRWENNCIYEKRVLLGKNNTIIYNIIISEPRERCDRLPKHAQHCAIVAQRIPQHNMDGIRLQGMRGGGGMRGEWGRVEASWGSNHTQGWIKMERVGLE